MPLLPCIDCGELTNSTRCKDCQRGVYREQDLNRPRRQHRGYDAAHEALRKQWAHRISIVPIPCVRCGEAITTEDKWHLDHTDDRTDYLGPSHAACNIRAASLNSRSS
jgi:hypothetical protein